MYRIIGADQKEYGPVTAEQIRQWISEGRANAQTLVRFEEGPWKPLGTFAEFGDVLPPSAPSSGGSLPPMAGGPMPVGPKDNGMAITGLIFSVLGLFQCCTPVFALLGLILSSIGYYQINNNPDLYRGRGLALAGIIVSALGLVIFIVLLLTGALGEIVRNMPEWRNR